MIRRSTWIIFVIFLAFLGGGWYFQKYQAEKKAQVTPTSEVKHLFGDLDQAQIIGFEIDSSQGKKLSVALDESGNWVVAGFTAADTNTYTMQDMLTKITALSIMTEFESAPALDAIGLMTPVYVFKVTVQGGQQKSAYIGNLTPIKSGYYARLENGNPVVVSQYAVENLINYLDNPPVATPVPTVTETIVADSTPTPQP